MKALVIGAKGATGKELVNVLLQDLDYTEIVLFVRHQSKITHAKLFEIITDFTNIDAVSQFIKGDVWFSCLETIRKSTGSREKQ